MTRNLLSRPDSGKKQRGFSLLEMAVVLMIIGVLLGGILMPLSSQQEIKQRTAANNQLDEIHDALLGFAARTGRLPCPATNTSNGEAAPVDPTTPTAVACNAFQGFVPARTLGLSGSLDNRGRLLDAWLNPVRYRLSDVGYHQPITTGLVGNIRVCSADDCPVVLPDRILIADAVAVIYSLGPDGANTPVTPANQRENTDNDDDFVTRPFSEAPQPVFNDSLRWISPNLLILTLTRAGQLP